MKKQWLPLVVAILFVLAPVVRADDGSVASAFGQLIAQVVALFTADRQEIGEIFPPFGAAEPGDQAEIGEICPPWG